MKSTPTAALEPKEPRNPVPAAESRFDPRNEMPGVILLTVTAALLRFPFLSRFGLWLDEIYVRDHALEPIIQNLRSVHFIHFIAVKPGLALWDTPFGLRLASACFGVAMVPLGYFAIRNALGKSTALLFGFFLTAVPYFLNYSIDANYYSHMMFWSVAGLGAAVRLFERKEAVWLLLIVPLGLIAFFVHPFSALYFGALALIACLAIVGGEKKLGGNPVPKPESHSTVFKSPSSASGRCFFTSCSGP